jgi:hypothetical protein
LTPETGRPPNRQFTQFEPNREILTILLVLRPRNADEFSTAGFLGSSLPLRAIERKQFLQKDLIQKLQFADGLRCQRPWK